MNAHIASLQQQVDTLFANLSTLRSDLAANHNPIDPLLQDSPYAEARSNLSGGGEMPTDALSVGRTRTKSHITSKPPTFRGLTSSDFNFDLAKHSLQSMGITSDTQGVDGGGTANATPAVTPPPERAHEAKDPIWSISRDEALRLLRVYEHDTHGMYPVLSIPQLVAHANSLYDFMEAASRSGLVKTVSGPDAIEDEETNMLKLALAVGMILEGAGQSELGRRLFEYVQPNVDALLLGNPSVKDVQILALTVRYWCSGSCAGAKYEAGYLSFSP